MTDCTYLSKRKKQKQDKKAVNKRRSNLHPHPQMCDPPADYLLNMTANNIIITKKKVIYLNTSNS